MRHRFIAVAIKTFVDAFWLNQCSANDAFQSRAHLAKECLRCLLSDYKAGASSLDCLVVGQLVKLGSVHQPASKLSIVWLGYIYCEPGRADKFFEKT